MHDVLEDEDHAVFYRAWLASARERLVHEDTGLLQSAFTYAGTVRHGPEGSSIWMAAHCLKLIDPEFAADQYARARRALGREWLGFGWAREWAPGHTGAMDIDSGPIIPILEVSAGSSGLAFLGAAAFGDADYYRSLATTVQFAGFPVERDGRLRYCAGNQVGDAVLLYSTVTGPLWDEIQARDREPQP